MSGQLINDYGIGDVHFDRWMETTDAQRIGFHSLTLTEFDTSTVPAIAAGSKIELNGALATFDSEEAIAGSPGDGTVYIYFTEEIGTASGATTDSTGYAIGTTIITLASAGTGTIIVGDRVTFAGDTVKYEITSGDADVSNGGTITIAAPGLLNAIPAAPTAITVYAGAITANFTNSAPTWSDAKQGWYSGNDRYANYKMTKTGSNYANKTAIPFAKTPDFTVEENGDTVCNDIACAAITGSDEAAATAFNSYATASATNIYSDAINSGNNRLQIWQSGAWQDVNTSGPGTYIDYNIHINPGLYRMEGAASFYVIRPISCFVNVNTGGPARVIFCTGVYGSDTISAARIIV